MTRKHNWVESDGGRTQSRRPKQTNDCTVRAMAHVLDLPYDTAYDMLAKAGRKCNQGFHITKFLEQFLYNPKGFRGYAIEKLSFPAVKGQKRMNPVSFCEQYPKGRYICRTAKHVFAVIDGIVYDTWEQRDDRCIYLVYQFTQV